MSTVFTFDEGGTIELEFAPGDETLEFVVADTGMTLAIQMVGGESVTGSVGGELTLLVDGGPPGPRGPIGDAALPALHAIAQIDMPIGTPVALNRATRALVPADAAIYNRAFVIGLLAEDALAGFVAGVTAVGSFGLDDLVPGQLYYLAEGGGITATRPTARGSSVVVIGEAITPTVLDVRRTPPILL